MIYSDAYRPCITMAKTGLMVVSVHDSYYGAWYERSKTVRPIKAASIFRFRGGGWQSEPVKKVFSLRRAGVTRWNSIKNVVWRQVP